jgi:5-hydroxyisourate hydrolase
MGLSTHVLDTMNGHPASGMKVALYELMDGQYVLLQEHILNQDGRVQGGLIDNDHLKRTQYRLTFAVASYFKSLKVELAEPNFLDQVNLDFGVANAKEHYHVPLLVSPWSYSTYRGS